MHYQKNNMNKNNKRIKIQTYSPSIQIVNINNKYNKFTYKLLFTFSLF